MTKGTALNNRILIEAGKRWPHQVRLWRRNVGFFRIVREDGSVHPVRFGMPGEADLDGILRGGRRLAVETKTEGDRMSKDQVAFREMILRFGGVHIVARSVEDFVRQMEDVIGLEESGNSWVILLGRDLGR